MKISNRATRSVLSNLAAEQAGKARASVHTYKHNFESNLLLHCLRGNKVMLRCVPRGKAWKIINFSVG